MISRAVKRAWKEAQIKKFVFHNYRNTALTDWADKGIDADIATNAAGHTSVQMHKHYLDLQRSHLAKALDSWKMATRMVDKTNPKTPDNL